MVNNANECRRNRIFFLLLEKVNDKGNAVEMSKEKSGETIENVESRLVKYDDNIISGGFPARNVHESRMYEIENRKNMMSAGK